MKCGIVWLRRDLRLADNVALFEAARECERVCVAFVIDPALLAGDRMGAPLVASFFEAIAALRDALQRLGSDLALLQGAFAEQLASLACRIGATMVYYNEDYEPSAIARDRDVERALAARGIETRRLLDHVYFGADEIVRPDGVPYRVFTPFKRRWLERLVAAPRPPVPSETAIGEALLPAAQIGATRATPAPEEFGFASNAAYPRVTEAHAQRRLAEFAGRDGAIERYDGARDVPALDGTSRLSPHLRAGTIGIRTCVERARQRAEGAARGERTSAERWLSELIWREFYQAVLKHFPQVAGGPFLEAAQHVPWRSDESDFAAWCEARTGYPIVDAAMRQLNETGWMHNRLRMIVASFLAKDLLLDWRWGERYFERHLADADLAQNNGGWQWAASTGTDAAPYFRIFNPVTQGRRFDPDGDFVRRMLPELRGVPAAFIHAPWTMPPLLQATTGVRVGDTYPAPIVDHAAARERALVAFTTAFARGATARER